MKVLTFFFLSIFSAFYNQSDTTNKKIIIGIGPIGSIKKADINIVKEAIEEYYKCTVIVFDKIDFPNGDTIFSKDTIRTVDALTFIDSLKIQHLKCDLLISLTNKPIVIETAVGTFVHRGMTRKESSIISTFKIYKDAENNKKLFPQYLAKISLHECGHFFGLLHCTYSCKCFMIGLNYCKDCPECVRITDMNNMKNFYASDNDLCAECKKKLNLGIQKIIVEKGNQYK